MSTDSRNRLVQQRRGSLVFAVLACLIVATVIVLGTVSVSSKFRRQMREELQLEQTSWLLDAGVRLAVEKIKLDANYRGQEITIESVSGDAGAGTINIVTWPEEGQSDSIRLKVTASLHRGAAARLSDMKQTPATNHGSERAGLTRRSVELLVAPSQKTYKPTR